MGQRLLLVDSDRSFLKEHQVSLEAAFDLDVCPSPEGVLPRLEQGAYAAALICVEVADNKGYALCSAIRKSPLLADLKVALISAKATEEEYRRHQSLKGRADLYLHKPIAPSALVSLLTPLVPVKTLDPDNPLGELVDTELGDDWLEGLRASIEEPPAPPLRRAVDLLPPLPPPEAAVTQKLDLRATAAADTSRMRLLEDQVAALHEELRARDQKLAAASADLQQLQRQLSSVTLNLDELEKRNRDAEALREKLTEAEAALQRLEDMGSRDSEALKNQLKETLTERTDLLHQVEALNLQLSEKTQRTIELLKERDRLQLQALELDAFRGRAEELEIALQGREQKLAEFQEAHAQMEEAQAQLNESLEGLATRHHELEGIHQAALLDAAGHKEHAHNLQMELAGLEATLRGQGRDLAALNDRIRVEEETNLGLQASLAECQRALEARSEEALRLEANLLVQAQRAAELQQRYDESTIQHEGERLELMNGLDQKESELARLAQALASQQEELAARQEAQAALEADRQGLEAQLAESRERSGRLETLVQEASDLLRRGSDPARD